MIEAPPATSRAPGDAAGLPEARALRTWVEARLPAGQELRTDRYFRLQESVGWNAVSKFVANQRSPTGQPPEPSWRGEDLDLIDIYPADDGRPAFAVAMSGEQLADGTKLVGYFELAER